MVPGFLASSAPPPSPPHLALLSCWCLGFLFDEIKLVRGRKGLLMALPEASLWVTILDGHHQSTIPITTVSMQQLLSPRNSCPRWLYESVCFLPPSQICSP